MSESAKPLRALVSWSAGKDSALALHEVRRRSDVEPVGLVTTVTEGYDRVSMHGVRRELLVRQASSLGLPLEEVRIPQRATNDDYEDRLFALLRRHGADGVRHVVYGDLFLEDVRAWREASLAKVGFGGVYPLWGRDTRELAATLVRDGFRAVVVCVDPRQCDPALAGRWIDEGFLAELPEGVDPCGENGEFHTFVADGPGFREPVAVETGEIVERDGFVFCDLVPG